MKMLQGKSAIIVISIIIFNQDLLYNVLVQFAIIYNFRYKFLLISYSRVSRQEQDILKANLQYPQSFFFHSCSPHLYLSIFITKDTIKAMGTPNQCIQQPEYPQERESSLAQSTRGPVSEFQDQKCWHKYQIRIKNPKIQLFPYNCIGMLSWKNSAKNDREEIGTAFLVDSRLILTALHNALDNFNNLHQNMQFYPKRNCSMNSNHTTSEFAMVIDIKKTGSSYKANQNPADDFCLLLLDKPIKREQYIKLGYDYSLAQNLNAEIFGYPHELMTKINEFSQFGTKGRIDSIQNGVIYYEIATSGGQSGSPLLVQTSDQQKIAVGVHNKAWDSRQKNCACQLTYKKIELIHRWAYELTGQPSKIQVVNCQKIKLETNPLAEQERKSHQYSFITQVHNFINKPMNPEDQKLSSSIKRTASIRSDLWATIKTGNFNINKYPYNCIGLIVATYTDSRNKACKHYGTGFLVNSRIVLTSIYNLIKFQDSYSFQFDDIVFYPGLHGDINECQNLQRKRKVVGKRYNIPRIKPSTLKERVDTSLAVLLLDNPVPVRTRYIMIGEDYDEKEQVYLFGYGWNELNRTNVSEFTSFKQRGSEGKVKQVKQNTIFHDAYSENGSQGSPILVQYVEGQFFIIGIHIVSKRKGNNEEQCMALLMTPRRVRMVNEWIKQLRQKRTLQSYSLKETQSSKIRLPTLRFSYLERYNHYMQLIFKKDNTSKSEALTNLAYYAHMIGKFQESNQYLMEELDLSQTESYFKQRKINQVYYYNLMGVNNIYLRNYQNAESNFRQAENIMRGEAQNLTQREKAIVLNNMGVIYVKKGIMEQAFNYFKQAILSIDKKDKIFLSVYNNNNSLYHKLKKTKQNQLHSVLIESFAFLSEPKSADYMLSTAILAYNLSISYLAEANYREVIDYLEVYVGIMSLLGLTQNPQYIDNVKWIETLVQSIISSNIIDRKIILKAVKLFRKVVRMDEISQKLLKKLMGIILPINKEDRKAEQK